MSPHFAFVQIRKGKKSLEFSPLYELEKVYPFAQPRHMAYQMKCELDFSLPSPSLLRSWATMCSNQSDNYLWQFCLESYRKTQIFITSPLYENISYSLLNLLRGNQEFLLLFSCDMILDTKLFEQIGLTTFCLKSDT